jgi:hypothetical protein
MTFASRVPGYGPTLAGQGSGGPVDRTGRPVIP